MVDFSPLTNARPTVGLVLQIPTNGPRYWRVTHLFENALYFVWVNEPEKFIYARRPFRRTYSQIDHLCSEGAVWGRLALPQYLASSLSEESDQSALTAAWEQISPLIETLSIEDNLDRTNFTRLIRSHAESKQIEFRSLYRSVLRYYYFGALKRALLPLPRGPRIGYRPYALATSSSLPQKRRGRLSGIERKLGVNDFVLSQSDIQQMMERIRKALSSGPLLITDAYENYMREDFAKTHPTVFREYVDKRRTVPVTLRQFRYHANLADLDSTLIDNLLRASRPGDHTGSLYASGPAEVYEIDSTGGRIHLVSKYDRGALLGTPLIYLIIDRWSRYIPSVYMSLRDASYEEVRHALLVAFTSRERFQRLGVDVDDETWPIGRVSASLCCDRGSEYLSYAMIQSAVDDLRIEQTILPPYCPDAKAIVENTIGTLKARMVNSGLKGVYAKRPIDPISKRAKKAASAVAVETLGDAYRVLIEKVIEHNNREHSALRKLKVLAQAGVPPTPQAAYLWGLENISSLRRPPLTDEDYRRLLLSIDKASLSNGQLRYRKHLYDPADEAAHALCMRSGKRPRQISIRVDKPSPYEVFCPDSQGNWARFEPSRSARNEMDTLQPDEEDVLESQGATLWVSAKDDSLRTRLSDGSKRSGPSRKRAERKSISEEERRHLRKTETKAIKGILTQQPQPREFPHQDAHSSEDGWVQREQDSQLKALDIIRKHRRGE